MAGGKKHGHKTSEVAGPVPAGTGPISGSLPPASTGRRKGAEELLPGDPRIEPNWNGKCEVCGESPTVPLTGMCGPCTFGEADTAGGDW